MRETRKWRRVALVVLLLTAAIQTAGEPTAFTAAQVDLLRVLGAGFLGAFLVKLFDIAYQEMRSRSERRRTARRFVDEHLDPVIRAADELVGKLRSLAVEDFKALRKPHSSSARYHDLVDLLYLFAKLWASLEVFRAGGQAVSVVRDKRGKRLTQFVDCMESRAVRIVRRSSQRAIAELALVQRTQGRVDVVPFIDFVRKLENASEAQRWLSPLERVFDRIEHTANRQRVLRYGIVIHAMIDTLDQGHAVSRYRPSYPHKLSKKSRNDLRFRVFRVYLTFVKRTDKYLQFPRRHRHQKLAPTLRRKFLAGIGRRH
ncbi:MAG: hypothetical protein OXS50_01985 [Gammaproteobacteria bacterium]|nr:hypothetical protein [Gammaproteobacteria bacterium]